MTESSAPLQRRLAEAIRSGRFSHEALRAVSVTAAASSRSFETVLAEALDNADRAAALLGWSTHRT